GDRRCRSGALGAGAGTPAARLDKRDGAVAAAANAPNNAASTSKVIDGLLARLDSLENASRNSGDTPAILRDPIPRLETSTAVLSGRLDALADQMQALATKAPGAEDS